MVYAKITVVRNDNLLFHTSKINTSAFTKIYLQFYATDGKFIGSKWVDSPLMKTQFKVEQILRRGKMRSKGEENLLLAQNFKSYSKACL